MDGWMSNGPRHFQTSKSKNERLFPDPISISTRGENKRLQNPRPRPYPNA